MADSIQKSFLVVNAAHDVATQYLRVWSDKIIREIVLPQHIEPLQLNGPDANKESFEKTIQQKSPRLILFHCHGDQDCVCGYDQDFLVKCGQNIEILNGKIVHALSCRSAKQLGLECTSAGTISYIGYMEDFWFGHQKKTDDSEILKDVWAKWSLEPAFEVFKSLLSGSTVEISLKSSQDLAKKHLAYLLSSTDPNAGALASALFRNLSHQVAHGDTKVTFS